jgi:hypothetical protein
MFSPCWRCDVVHRSRNLVTMLPLSRSRSRLSAYEEPVESPSRPSGFSRLLQRVSPGSRLGSGRNVNEGYGEREREEYEVSACARERIRADSALVSCKVASFVGFAPRISRNSITASTCINFKSYGIRASSRLTLGIPTAQS